MTTIRNLDQINGFAEPRFSLVADAFARNFENGSEAGAAVCVHVDGRVVVDMWSGIADVETGQKWTEATAAPIYSSTKAATALCAHILVQRRQLDLDAPVSDYWPEFAAEGKGGIPVRWLLSHRAGLPAFEPALPFEALLEGTPVVNALAKQRPFWQPGSDHGYHALTFGWLVGEVVRRVSGKSLGTFFAEEVADPAQLDFWIGLPEAEEVRTARMIAADVSGQEIQQMLEGPLAPGGLAWNALSVGGAIDAQDFVNSRAVHAAEMPAANGITTARSLSRMYAAMIGEVDGVRLLSDAAVDEARLPQSDGPDRVLQLPTRFGLGFMLHSPPGFDLLDRGSFGHGGSGGSLGFAAPEAGVAFGYVMNNMGPGMLGDPRSGALVTALRASLEGT